MPSLPARRGPAARSGPGTAAGRQQRPRRGGAAEPTCPWRADGRRPPRRAPRSHMYLKRPAGGLAFCLFYLASSFTNKVSAGAAPPGLGRAGRGAGSAGALAAGPAGTCGSGGRGKRRDPGAGERRKRGGLCFACPAQGEPEDQPFPDGNTPRVKSPWHSSPPPIPVCSRNRGSGAGFILLRVRHLQLSTADKFHYCLV